MNVKPETLTSISNDEAPELALVGFKHQTSSVVPVITQCSTLILVTTVFLTIGMLIRRVPETDPPVTSVKGTETLIFDEFSETDARGVLLVSQLIFPVTGVREAPVTIV